MGDEVCCEFEEEGFLSFHIYVPVELRNEHVELALIGRRLGIECLEK
jgi:hypothetical protein